MPVPAHSPQKGSKHFYFSTCRTESATHTLCQPPCPCSKGPQRACVGDAPFLLPPNSKDPSAGKPQANERLADAPARAASAEPAPVQEGLNLDGSWKLFLRVTWDGVAAERTPCRRQVVTVSV